MQNCTVEKAVLKGGPRYSQFAARTGAHSGDVCYGASQYASHAQNEVQRLQVTGSPTSGTVVLTFNGTQGQSLGQDTGTIAYNATATDVLTALEALSGINIGDVKVTGGPWPGAPIDVEFLRQYGNTDMSALVLKTNSLGGGSSPSLTITERSKGGTDAVYLVAIKNHGDSTVTMYKVDGSSGAMTSIATGLTASTWNFEQYKDKVFAFNATDGLNYYRLGGSWNDGAGTTKPKPPAVKPVIADYLESEIVSFSSGFASITQSGLGGSPTVSGTATGITITNGASGVTTQTEITVTATYSSAQDFSHYDVWQVTVKSNVVTEADLAQGSLDFDLINNDGSPVTITPLASATVAESNILLRKLFHFGNKQRTSRDNTLKFQIKFTVDLWAASKQVTIQLTKGRTWLASLDSFAFDSGINWPTPDRAKIRYAYSYFNATTSVESDLSEATLSADVPITVFGNHVTVRCRGSSELTTSDRIYVYRQERKSGLWRRLPTNANNTTTWGVANVTSGTADFNDVWMESELDDFPTPNLSPFGGSTAGAVAPTLAYWKQSLVAGALRKVWASFVGDPRAFAPDPDDREAKTAYAQENADNEDAGRTWYMADDRSDEVYAIIGQDSLYPIGARASYAIVGDFPMGSSPPRRLPGSRGTVSQWAAHRFGGGAHVCSADGLWYYSVGRGFSGEDNGALVEREETLEVRRSYIDTLLGSSYSGLASCEYRDEVWVTNGTKYLRRTRDGDWEEGTFTDSALLLLSTRTLSLRYVSTTGKIYTIASSHTDDNGTSATWTYETGVLDGPPTRITDIELQVKGAPRVTVRVYTQDGDKSSTDFGKYTEYIFDTEEAQEPYRKPLSIKPGLRYKIVFSGTVGSDEVHSCALEVQPSGKQYNG